MKRTLLKESNLIRLATLSKIDEGNVDGVWDVVIKRRNSGGKEEIRVMILNPNYNDMQHVWMSTSWSDFYGIDDVAEICCDWMRRNILDWIKRDYYVENVRYELALDNFNNNSVLRYKVFPLLNEKAEVFHVAYQKEVNIMRGGE